jgi:hypothetical protein
MKIKIKKRKTHKLDENSSYDAKIKVRKFVVDSLKNKDPMILDCFAAKGKMWELAYDKTPNYLGIDMKLYLDDRKMICADNLSYLKSADLDQFDIFDLDAYGSPMNAIAIIAKRFQWRTKTEIGIVFTDGTGFNAKMSGTSKKYAAWLGLQSIPKIKSHLDYRDDLIKMAIIKCAEIAGAKTKYTKAFLKNKGSYMRYVGFVLSRE